MTERIPQEELDKNWRNFVRRVAGLIVLAMADEDMGFAAIGSRIGMTEDEVRQYVLGLVECTIPDVGRSVCDLTYAMGHRISLELRHLPRAPIAEGDKASDVSEPVIPKEHP